jgi:hypothetical protein
MNRKTALPYLPTGPSLSSIGAARFAVEAMPRPSNRRSLRDPSSRYSGETLSVHRTRTTRDLLPSSRRRDIEQAQPANNPIRVAVHALTCIQLHSRAFRRFHLRTHALIPPHFVTATVTVGKQSARLGRALLLSPPVRVARMEAHPVLAMKEGSLVPPPAFCSREALRCNLNVARFDVVEERLRERGSQSKSCRI